VPENTIRLREPGMNVYRVRYGLAADPSVHTAYLYAPNPKEATRKLVDRFPKESIHIASIEEEHGTFVIGSEEWDFSE
jgi:hypothetical protein